VCSGKYLPMYIGKKYRMMAAHHGHFLIVVSIALMVSDGCGACQGAPEVRLMLYKSF
jgi:hypothetical protein